METALLIHVKGIVQGVGFRPFVYRLAKRYLVSGWVLNAADGVTIHAQGDERLVDEFVLEIANAAPAAAQVDEIELKEIPLGDFDGFEIRFSDTAAVEETTLVSPDLATCGECAAELFDPSDRRFRYPFINCTNCGPRFTIIDALPYDRASTSMAAFSMCGSCAAEYADPGDRRFHAQPDACFECGPQVSWVERAGAVGAATEDALTGKCAGAGGAAGSATKGAANVWGATIWGDTRERSDAVFARAVELLCAGGILAVKGLGGFHLVCDAENEHAVAELRRRKRREGKAFAVMMADVDSVRRFCEVSDEEAAVLSGSQRPIVLLRKRAVAAAGAEAAAGAVAGELRCGATDAGGTPEANGAGLFVPGLADALPELGVMLPYTPVQHLLMHDFVEAGGCMLVMTSGNLHDEPIVTDDGEARRTFAGLADAILGNNRAIRSRYDDSVVRVLNVPGGPAIQMIRRARGYAPVPLSIKVPSGCTERMPAHTSSARPAVFAVGPEQKNTFCLVRGTAQSKAPGSALERVGGGGTGAPAAPSGAPDSTRMSAAEDAASPRTHASEYAIAAGTSASGKTPANGTVSSPQVVDAFVSQHIGDLENAETFAAWREAAQRYETLFDVHPVVFACDKHPEYLSTKWVEEELRRAARMVQPAAAAGSEAPASAAPASGPGPAPAAPAPASPPMVVRVQHHHAHIASVMAEHALEGPVCGIAFDGTGYGQDGAIWGGEVLLCNLTAFERFLNLAYVPMPGGAACVKHPLRMAYGALWAFDLLEHPAARAALEPLGPTADMLGQMIDKGLNTPYTSSAGRLFDAASALLGICANPLYEGEPAILLEAAMEAGGADAAPAAGFASAPDANVASAPAADIASASTPSKTPAASTALAPPTADAAENAAPAAFGAPASCAGAPIAAVESDPRAYHFVITKNTATAESTAQDTSVLVADAAPVFAALLDDAQTGVPTATIARRFHDAFVELAVQSAQLVRSLYGINIVALAGGVFMNRYLAEHTLAALAADGFTVALNRDLPPNDGSISYGQAAVALASLG